MFDKAMKKEFWEIMKNLLVILTFHNYSSKYCPIMSFTRESFGH